LIGTASATGAIRPGEFSLAHGGLLLADEFLEWSRDSREALREPLERGRVTLTRARRSIELPASFALAANGNLCPCGGWPPQLSPPQPSGETGAASAGRCRCSAKAASQYLARLSGPVLDRLDLVAMALMPARAGAAADRLGFEELKARVDRAREHALTRWGKPAGQLGADELERLLGEHPHWADLLGATRFASLRGRHKILRVALTLSDWDGLAEPGAASFAEAAMYRAERFGIGA
jgi:magnesium chelatase family protein